MCFKYLNLPYLSFFPSQMKKIYLEVALFWKIKNVKGVDAAISPNITRKEKWWSKITKKSFNSYLHEPLPGLIVPILQCCCWRARERPEEVKAEHRHPAEHEDSREVKSESEMLASRFRDGDEEFVTFNRFFFLLEHDL